MRSRGACVRVVFSNDISVVDSLVQVKMALFGKVVVSLPQTWYKLLSVVDFMSFLFLCS